MNSNIFGSTIKPNTNTNLFGPKIRTEYKYESIWFKNKKKTNTNLNIFGSKINQILKPIYNTNTNLFR